MEVAEQARQLEAERPPPWVWAKPYQSDARLSPSDRNRRAQLRWSYQPGKGMEPPARSPSSPGQQSHQLLFYALNADAMASSP